MTVTSLPVESVFSSIPEELRELVYWGAASNSLFTGNTKNSIKSMAIRSKRYMYCTSILVHDEFMKQILARLIEEIGPLSKSFLRYEWRNDWMRGRQIKQQTGSGEHLITDCIHPYDIHIGQEQPKLWLKAGFFFNESIREVTVFLFCKLLFTHPLVQRKIQVKEVTGINMAQCQLISDYETEVDLISQ